MKSHPPENLKLTQFHGKMKNENEKMRTKHEKIGNEATDRARVQEVLFPFFIFPFPTRRVPRFSNIPVSFRGRAMTAKK